MLFQVFVLLSFVSVPVITRVAENHGEVTCRRADVAEFSCSDGSGCVGLQALCDGVKNCVDGSDEVACPYPIAQPLESDPTVLHRKKRQTQINNCSSNQWQCRDGSCISFDGKCDGVIDCPDRSDETQALCRNMPCQANWFRCTYGACVDGTAPCNGVTECADNSDELLPRCKNKTIEIKGKFKCKDGSLIESSDLCDGKVDCTDRSDEVIDACADHTCPSYLFQCAYGACVDRGADCDGIMDCADGSDESSELCNRIGKPITSTTEPSGRRPGFCVLPPYPAHGTYTVANMPNASPGQSATSYVLTVTCQQGYGVLNATDKDGTQKIYCVSGIWYSDVSDCVRFCKLQPDPSVRYVCRVGNTNGFAPCDTFVAPGTIVKPICNSPNYYSPETLAYMNCIDGSFDKVTTCKPGLIKNGTNITIIIKDKVEIHISGFSYGGEDISINVDNTNPNVGINNSERTTANPIIDEISENDWRMGPVIQTTGNANSKIKNIKGRDHKNNQNRTVTAWHAYQ